MAGERAGDLYDFEHMSDDEVREVVLEHFREYAGLDMDDVDVTVRDGFVTVSGRVGTDGEVRVAESILDDVLGLERFANDLVVDEVRRASAPAAADDAIEWEEEMTHQAAEPAAQQSDTAEHLVEDLDSETHGTRDPGQAIRDATSYTPPDRPFADGYGSEENH